MAISVHVQMSLAGVPPRSLVEAAVRAVLSRAR
jgi:hypothetical protein